MAAEWISRGAGPRDSRELLTALDNLGVSHAESAQSLHTFSLWRLWAAIWSRLWKSSPTWCCAPPRRDEVEPIRALCLAKLA